VLLLLDCYLAGVHLGEGDSSLFHAAARAIEEIAFGTAKELTALATAGTGLPQIAPSKSRATSMSGST
jgi:hypothetical protein